MAQTPRIGELAPALTLPSLDGTEVDLASLRGKPVWLSFHRYASCPLCNIRIHQMKQRYAARHGKDVHILAVVQSPIAKMHKYMDKHEAPFHLLADPAEKYYRSWGIGESVLGFLAAGGPKGAMRLAQAAKEGFVGIPDTDGTVARLPGEFLIGPDGVIEDVFMAKDISEHMPFEQVDAFLVRHAK